jgi:hypothetical protein
MIVPNKGALLSTHKNLFLFLMDSNIFNKILNFKIKTTTKYRFDNNNNNNNNNNSFSNKRRRRR